MGILELKNVYYNYRNKHQTVEVLKDVSCSFETGKNIRHNRQIGQRQKYNAFTHGGA